MKILVEIDHIGPKQFNIVGLAVNMYQNCNQNYCSQGIQKCFINCRFSCG